MLLKKSNSMLLSKLYSMSNEQQRYDYPNYNGQNSPYQRNMNNPNMNNPNMNNRNMNNPNMNNFNMNNRNMNNFNSNGPNMNRFNMNGPNMNRPRPARKEWGLVHRFNVTADNDTDTKPSNNSNENDRTNNNNSIENRSFEPPPSPGQNNPQQNFHSSINQQNNNNDDQNGFYQSNRNKYSPNQGNQYEDSFANKKNSPNYYGDNSRDNFRSNEQDRGRNNYYSNESDYNRRYHDDRRYDDRYRDNRRPDDRYDDRDNRRFDERYDDRDGRNNRRFDSRYDDHDNRRNDDRYDDRRYNDRDNYRQSYKQDRHHFHDDHDSYNDRGRHGDRNESRNDRGRHEDDYSSRRYQSLSTTPSTNSASISSSSSTNIQRSNSLPRNKIILPNSASPPKNSPSPIQYMPSPDSDIEVIDQINSNGKEQKKKINTSSLVTRHEVVDQPNNISEMPNSIKKLTQGNKENAPVKEQHVNKDFAIISKPKKKVALISPSSSTLSSHNLFNDIDSKPKNHVEGLTPIKKKTPLNLFEKGISPFPEIKKSGKDNLYELISRNANVNEWIEQKLSAIDNNDQNRINEDDKLSDNFDDLDFNKFIHEFHFDEDILRRNDWQKNPEPLIKKISECELDFQKNNGPIEAFIVKDKDDPYYYDTNLFTLKPVMTENEKITNLLSKYNLPDVSDYINDQISKIEEDIQKSTKNLNK